MQTKFKKGDRVEVVDKQHPFFGWKGTVQEQVDHPWIRVDFDNGQCIDVHKDLIITTTTSPRLASEMTLREHYAGLVLQGLLSDPNVSDLHQAASSAVSAADYLIQALNEKP